ncbi:RAD52 motif-containing protein [Porites harrisoni]
MADIPSVELIEFVRPYSNEVNLYVTSISKRLDKETAQVKLLEIFSEFGLVYEVQVIDSSDYSEASEDSSVSNVNFNCSSMYAFVKFYSRRAASRAKGRISGRCLLAGQLLKVQFAQRRKGPENVQPPLYMAKCTELANYYFGFNGWTTRIIVQMDRLTDQHNCDKQGKAITAMFRCVVRLEIKGCDFYCDGSGYGGDRDVIHQEKDPTKKIQLLGYAKKLAHRHAFENAFRRVIILSLENGKVGVEINQKDIPELGSDDLKEDGIINVNYFDEEPLSDADEEQVAELEADGAN